MLHAPRPRGYIAPKLRVARYSFGNGIASESRVVATECFRNHWKLIANDVVSDQLDREQNASEAGSFYMYYWRQ
jgi:hypothetical protein